MRTEMPAGMTQAAPAQARDYIQLLKPRIMLLVVFTALAGLVAAHGVSGTKINLFMAAVVILAVSLGSGAAGAINMWYDADIDAMMSRTESRPIPAGLVPRAEALTLGIIMSVAAILLIWMASNALAALLLAVSILYYGWFYTMVLKRRTAQNIVIGGGAGAFPPVIGWAAVTGSTPLDAWLLFALIFFWTPPHFWALSLVAQKDYSRAGVPMLPVISGAKATRRQILLYSLSLVPVGFAPVLTGLGGMLYLTLTSILTLIFLALAVRLWRSRAGEADMSDQDRKCAMQLFAFSILYLFGLFAALIIEHGFAI